MKETIQFDQQLDCSGLSCPLPVLKTKKAVDAMNSGQVLKMTCTDSGSVKDMPSWSSRTGHHILHYDEEGDQYTWYIQVK